jgi:hypothetical protein
MDNAILCLQEKGFRNVLLGACDELTPQLIDILNRISKFGKPGLYGEGGAGFILSKEKENCIAEIKYFDSAPERDVPEIVNDLLAKYSIDYIFTLHNNETFSVVVPQILYTNYFGDFPTCAACGFWFALDCLNSKNPPIPCIRNILLVSENRYGMAFITVVGK